MIRLFVGRCVSISDPSLCVKAGECRDLVHGWIEDTLLSSPAKYECGPTGRPRVAGVGVSISYSGCWACVSIGPTGPAGVDIETVGRRIGDRDAFSRAILSAEERVRLARSNDFSLLEMWTLKEASLKALGVGLSIPMRSVLLGERRSHGPDTWCATVRIEASGGPTQSLEAVCISGSAMYLPLIISFASTAAVMRAGIRVESVTTLRVDGARPST